MSSFITWSMRLLRVAVPSARSLRMATYSAFAFGLLAAGAARSVYADAREMGLGIGHQLAKLEDLTGGAYLVRVNGTEIYRASAHTSQSPAEVLSRYETYCRENPGLLGRAMRDIPVTMGAPSSLPAQSPLRAAIVRDENDERGMVACFVQNPDAPASNFIESLRSMVETGDISKLGQFRYVFAERSNGTQGGSHVVTSWSDGELNVGKMFPSSGDAPGSDSSRVPRPGESRRTLSAEVEGYPGAVRVYESSATRADIERTYDQALTAKGFSKVPTNVASSLVYSGLDQSEIIVSFGTNANRTSVTIVETAASTDQGVRVEVKK